MAENVAIISSMATRQILAELVERYTSQSGRAVRLVSAGGVEVAQRIRAGETFDVVLLACPALQQLSDEGLIERSSIRPFALSRTAVAVKAGMKGAASCDDDALKSLLTGARAIGLSTGPSGAGIIKLLKDWGLHDALSDRLRQAPVGVPVAELLKSGDVDVAFQQLSELQGHSAIEIVGTLPDSLQPPTVFAVGMMTRKSDAAGAQDVLGYLISDDASDAKRRGGMEAV